MLRFSHSLLRRRNSHTLADSPSPNIKRRIEEWNRLRRGGRKGKKDELFVPVPESKYFLDTATMPMILTAVAIALFAKILMMVRLLHP